MPLLPGLKGVESGPLIQLPWRMVSLIFPSFSRLYGQWATRVGWALRILAPFAPVVRRFAMTWPLFRRRFSKARLRLFSSKRGSKTTKKDKVKINGIIYQQ